MRCVMPAFPPPSFHLLVQSHSVYRFPLVARLVAPAVPRPSLVVFPTSVRPSIEFGSHANYRSSRPPDGTGDGSKPTSDAPERGPCKGRSIGPTHGTHPHPDHPNVWPARKRLHGDHHPHQLFSSRIHNQEPRPRARYEWRSGLVEKQQLLQARRPTACKLDGHGCAAARCGSRGRGPQDCPDCLHTQALQVSQRPTKNIASGTKIG